MTTETQQPAASTIPEIQIDGQTYKVEFSWPTFAEARTKYGEDPDMMNPAVLSEYTALALKRHHPMITADQIMTASPPQRLSIALAQMNQRVGDLDGNRRKILDYARRAADAGADAVVVGPGPGGTTPGKVSQVRRGSTRPCR